MQGQLLNNKQIDELVKNRTIEIKPNYDVSNLQIAQYPLTPSVIFEIQAEETYREIFRFSEKKQAFILEPKKYYIIDMLESVILPKGIIGRFLPSSNLIEKGIVITTGKIEHPYGQKGEKVRFGLFNCLDFESKLEFNTRIAYIQFIDLRGSMSLSYNLTEYDKSTYSKRRNSDDGPNYEIDNHD